MLTIIIPTYNRNDLLGNCLDCLQPKIQQLNHGDYEVIVSDDSEKHSAKEFLSANYQWVKWIAGPQKGPAANRNNGAKNANGKWLVFIDDDCMPDKNLLKTYQNAILHYPKISVFEGCIKADREKMSFAEEAPVNETGGYLWSCNFMIDKKVFLDEFEGFDENFPYAALEDVDLEYRIDKSGLKKVFLKDALVIHPWREQKHIWSITLKRFKSTLYFLKKHPEKKQQINSRYYLTAFYNSFVKNTFKQGFKYHFRGFSSKIAYDFLQLYFYFYTLGHKF